MKLHILFITAGEWPAQNGLLVSQVLETARALQLRGHTVSWLAAIPLLSKIKRWFEKNHDLKLLKAECQRFGIPFKALTIPVALGSPWSIGLRRWWHTRVVRRAASWGAKFGASADSTVLHARSYYAAEIALLLRESLVAQDPSKAVITSFDMRSLLAPEIPMTHGFFGIAAYGFIKELEFSLVRDSDISFLPVDAARRQYHEETGLNIRHAPIQGFDREPGWHLNFESRWAARRIGYSGSLGQWNDPSLLLAIFSLFPGFVPKLAVHPHDLLANLDCSLYQQSELPSYYDGLLALVIPGLSDVEGYFRTTKMRCNFFSTKAAEALSRGVPLIVSAELEELATFVRDHDCGMVFDLSDRKPILPAGIDLNSIELWHRLTINAKQVGSRFERQAVISVYERAWLAAIDRKHFDNHHA